MFNRYKKIKGLLYFLFITALSVTTANAGDIKCGADTTGTGVITQVADCNSGSPFSYAGIAPAPTVANSNLCPINQTNCSLRQYRCPEDNNIYTDNTTCNDDCIHKESCSVAPFTVAARNCPSGYTFQTVKVINSEELGWGWGSQYYTGCVSDTSPCPAETALTTDLLCRQLAGCPTDKTYYPSGCFCLLQGSEWEGVPMTCSGVRTPVIFSNGYGFGSQQCNCEGSGLPAAPSCPEGGYFNNQIQKCAYDLPKVSLCTRKWLFIKVEKASPSLFYLQYVDTGPSYSDPYHNECEPPTFADTVTGETWHTIEKVDLTSQIPAGTIDQWTANVKLCVSVWNSQYCVTSADYGMFVPVDFQHCETDFWGGKYNCGPSYPSLPYYYEITVSANDFTCPFESSIPCSGPGITKTCSRNTACNAEPVCPVSYNCNCTNGTTPSCSSIGTTTGTFDPNLNSCIVPAGTLCPSVTTWDGTANGCLSSPICDTGGTFNSATNFCEATVDITCPDSTYTYSSVTKSCEKMIDCPPGTTYDSVTHKCTIDAIPQCVNSFNYESSNKICYASSNCPSQTLLNTLTDRCEASPSCQSPTLFNSVTNTCELPPTCLAGATYNSLTDRCETAPTSTPTCNPPLTYDSVSQKCINAASCSTPGALNSSTDRCETPVLYNCSSGAYDSSLGQCSYSPSCTSTSPPYGAAMLAGTTSVSCPAGGTLIGSTPLCQVAGTLNGSWWSGYYWSCPSYSGWYAYTYVGGGQCQLQLSCPSGTTYNSTTHQCVPDAPFCTSTAYWACFWGSCNIYCGGGYSWNTATGFCTAQSSCPSGTAFNLSLNKCLSTATVSCPGGYTNGVGICVQTPACPPNSTYNAVTDRCEGLPTYVPSCLFGYNYDSSTLKCYMPSTCPVGTLNIATDKCEAVPLCPLDSILNTVTHNCEATPACSQGSLYNAVNDRCEIVPTWQCPNETGTSLDTSYGAGVCSVLLACPSSGTLSGTSPLCLLDANFNCPSGYTPDNGVCKEVAICTNGTLDAGLSKCKLGGSALCSSDWTFDPTLGSCKHIPGCSNSTYDAVNKLCCTCASANSCVTSTPSPTINDYSCSPNTCVDTKAPGATIPGQGDLTYIQNDLGFSSTNGSCAGQVYVFTGRPAECRTSGVQTLWNNCCDNPTGGLVGGVCNNNEVMTHSMVDGKLCHYVGDYCAEEWMFVGCVQSKRMYCCWDSKLARIIQEQGRTQLQKFNTAYCPSGNTSACAANNTYFNIPTVPDCMGLKPEDLQMLDWSKIDLSEYFTDVQVQMQNATQGLQQNMTDSVTNFYNQLKK